MRTKVTGLKKRMGASASEQPHTSGPSLRVDLDAATINTAVRRIGYVLSRVYEVMQGNLTSAGKYELAETLADCLKPLVDMLVHFELSMTIDTSADTEVDNEVP